MSAPSGRYSKPGTLYHECFLFWERGLLDSYLHITHGNRCKAAKLLGIHRNTFNRRLEIHGITKTEIQQFRRIV